MATILLVDDSTDMRLLLRDLLELNDHQVTMARTGREALALLENGLVPDTIISDIIMPEIDGIELFHHVRQNPDWAAIRFFVMSANPYDERLEAARAAGLDGLLPKPFSLNDLKRLLLD
jgi:CheY-like chemotaxis protein